MLEKAKEVLDKVPWSVLLIVYLAYVGYTDVYQFYYTDNSELHQKQVEIEKVKGEVAKKQADYKKAKDFEASLDKKRAEIRALAQELDEMKATLSETLDVPFFLKMIVTEAAKVGLSVVSLTPSGTKQMPYYVEQTFDLQFKAVYVQLLVFLERMASVERIIRIESLDAHPEGPNTAQYVQLAGKIELKTYRYVGSDADQVGKNGGTSPASANGAKPGQPATPASPTVPPAGGAK